jgi:DNA-binding NarL/FixJ family response regulator
MTEWRAVVAEPRLLVRQSLCAAVAARGADVVADVADARALVAATGKHRPDVAVITTELLDGSVPDLADRVRAEHGCRLLVIGRRAHQAELLQALEFGADGFLAPTAPLADLGKALDQIGAGESYIPPGMLSGLLRELINRRRDDDIVLRRFSRLSRREREVLSLIAAGAGLPEMAATLYLSHHTVRTHVQNVIEKLEVHSRVEAASMVVEYDLLGRFNEDTPPS